MAGSSWHNCGLTFDNPPGFVEQEETSSLDSVGREPMSIEWTDEKHRLYLTSMEASFVEQLYNSKGSFRWHQQREHGLDVNSGQGNPRVSGQYKVHHNGSWQMKHFYRPDPQPEANGSCNLSNPWINHFRGRGKPEMASSSFQYNDASMHQPLSCEGESLYNQVSYYCNEEVSDQNFVDEGCEPYRAPKRLKP